MKNTHRFFAPTALFIVAVLLIGCVNREVAPSLTVSYSPPLLPIEITYDVTTGSIKLALSGRIQTPIGTFKVSYGATSIAKRYNGVRTLTVVTGEGKYVYELEPGRPYSIKLPSDENGQAEVRYSGTDENLEIVIPNPTDETIANLKQQLEEERAARELAESQLPSPSPADQNHEGQAEPPQTPTPAERRVLTSQECQDLIAQTTSGQFHYIPPECQDMYRAYQDYLHQQEYEARRKREDDEKEARRKKQDADYERDRVEAERRKQDEEAARRRERQIRQWTNVIEGIIRRRRQ